MKFAKMVARFIGTEKQEEINNKDTSCPICREIFPCECPSRNKEISYEI